jgi:hypothetical protein
MSNGNATTAEKAAQDAALQKKWGVDQSLTQQRTATSTDPVSGKKTVPALAPVAAPGAAAPSAATPQLPAWVKPGDQYSPSRGQARDAQGNVYGPP